MYNIFISLLIFITFLQLTLIPSVFRFIPKNIKFLLPFWHLLFTYIYYLQSLSGQIDTNYYFQRSLDQQQLNFFGSKFIFFLTSIFSQSLSFSFFNTFFIFSLFGYLGILFFATTLFNIQAFKKGKYSYLLVVIIVFFPSLHFWSSAIGKDSLMFLAIGLIIWSGVKLNLRKNWFLFSFVLITLIRPHIGALLFLSFYANTLFKDSIKINKYLKLLIFLAPLLLLTYLPFLISDYFNLPSFSIRGFIDYLEIRSEFTSTGSLALDFTNINPIFRPFIFLYGPLSLKGSSLFYLLIFIENFYLFTITIITLGNILKNYFNFKNIPNFLFFTFPVLTLLLLSFSIGNIGIALRQKWMIIPFLYTYLINNIFAGKNRINKL